MSWPGLTRFCAIQPNFVLAATMEINYEEVLKSLDQTNCCVSEVFSVAEPHHFYAAPAPGKIFYAASAPAAPAPTIMYSKANFLKRTKV
jgi:hypothetical protein